MKTDKSTYQPLAEVFGFPIENETDRALRYRDNKLCPYNNIISNCTKNSIEFPLGVCSLNHKGKPVVICPIRFREDWIIMSDAAAFIFNSKENWTHVGEVRLKDIHGKTAGNIDYVLVSYDSKGRITDFGSLEVQAVYISGNLTGPFTAYLDKPDSSFSWTQAFQYPKPDYLSSSRKRLIPQIIAKGSILKQWNKKQVVALQTAFFNTLPVLPEYDKSEADFAFFLYDLEPEKTTNSLSLKLDRIVYTKYANALEHIAKFEAGSIRQFTELLQKKLDSKLSGSGNMNNVENIVIE
jgi:hypothetical protein